jgi:hypothetical protein
MRRFFTLLMALGLLAPMVGCRHVAGICDCDWGHNCCAAGTPPVGTPMLWMSAAPPAVEMGPGIHPASDTTVTVSHSSAPVSVVDAH